MEKIFEALTNIENQPKTTFYDVLGCGQNATLEQINAEYRVRALALHPDKNPDIQNSEEKFKELCEAKEILSDVEKRAKYDQWLNSGVLIPWKDWSNFLEKSQTVLHWRTKKQDPMIESPIEGQVAKEEETFSTLENFRKPRASSQQENNDVLSKFRNYQI